MIAIKGNRLSEVPIYGTDTLLSPMMCLALWATKHCVQGKILDDCPLVGVVNAYAGLVNIQTVERIYDIRKDFYYLKFKTDVWDSSNTFSCFNGMFTELEEGKDYNIRKLLGKDC